MKRDYSNYSPRSSEEINLIDQCKLEGVEVPLIWAFIREPEHYQVTEAIAQLFAKKILQVRDETLAITMMQAIGNLQFRELVLQPSLSMIRRHAATRGGEAGVGVLYKIALPKDAPQIADLLLDKKIGSLRSLLIPVYAKIAKKSGMPILRRMLSDPNTRTYALKHLSLLGDTTIEPELLELAKSDNPFFRKTANDALKRVYKNKEKLGKSQQLH
jgi:HEAT repeat protein